MPTRIHSSRVMTPRSSNCPEPGGRNTAESAWLRFTVTPAVSARSTLLWETSTVVDAAAGQKDPSMPEVKAAISQALRDRREQVLRAAFLAATRNDAVVVNLIAKRLVESKGKMPSLAPAAPGTK